MNNSYIAGFTDGEGSICFHSIGGSHTRIRNKKGIIVSKHEGWAPNVCLVNTDRTVLEEIRNFVNAGRIYSQKGSTEVHSTTNRLVFTSRDDIISFLKKINKYLITKREQASYMLKFCLSRKKRCPLRGSNSPYNQVEINCIKKVKELNMKASFRAKAFRVMPFVSG